MPVSGHRAYHTIPREFHAHSSLTCKLRCMRCGAHGPHSAELEPASLVPSIANIHSAQLITKHCYRGLLDKQRSPSYSNRVIDYIIT